MGGTYFIVLYEKSNNDCELYRLTKCAIYTFLYSIRLNNLWKISNRDFSDILQLYGASKV